MIGKGHRQWIVVTIFVGVSLFSTSCNNEKSQAAWWEGEHKRVELEQELALKNYRFNQLAGDNFETFQNLKVSVLKAKESLEKLRQQRRQLESEVASYEDQWEEFRETVLHDHRHQVIGKTFEILNSASGREYKNVTVVQIDDAGVTVRHDAGSARLRLGDLSIEQQLYFGLDAGLALVAETKERQEGAAYDQWIDQQMVAAKEVEQRKSEAANDKQGASEWKRSQVLARQYAASRERPLAQSSSSVGSRISRYYNSSSNYGPTYRYYYNNSNNCSGVPGFSVRPGYVGSDRSNAVVRPNGSPIQTPGGRSGCATPRVIQRSPTTSDSPTVSEP